MTVTVDPAIQQRYDQNAAARRAEAAEVTGELKARQDQIAEQIKKHEDNLAALGRRLAESTVDQPPPVPARRPKNEDISAEASAYQEADDEPEPPRPPDRLRPWSSGTVVPRRSKRTFAMRALACRSGSSTSVS